MNLEFHSVTLIMPIDEVRELFYSLRRDIKRAIAEHWLNHPDAYPKNEATRLVMLEQLNRLVDTGDVRREMLDYLTECIAKRGAV